MSKQYDNEMSGAIYKNDYKKAPNQPDYRGTIQINGVQYDQALWIKKTKDGKSFFSTSLSVKDAWKNQNKSNAPTLDEVKDELDDFVPF
jgi:hypothetical protein